MTDDEILELWNSIPTDAPFRDIINFARAIAAVEREACARVCEAELDGQVVNPDGPPTQWVYWIDCAAAIRGRTDA